MDGFNGESEMGDWEMAKTTMTEASERRHAEDTAEDAADGNAMLSFAPPSSVSYYAALSLSLSPSYYPA